MKFISKCSAGTEQIIFNGWYVKIWRWKKLFVGVGEGGGWVGSLSAPIHMSGGSHCPGFIACDVILGWPDSHQPHIPLTKVCQMLLWWVKNSIHSIIGWDIVTNIVPMYSAFHAPLYELNFTLLIRFVLMLPYLSMLFIFELSVVQDNSTIKNMLR